MACMLTTLLFADSGSAEAAPVTRQRSRSPHTPGSRTNKHQRYIEFRKEQALRWGLKHRRPMYLYQGTPTVYPLLLVPHLRPLAKGLIEIAGPMRLPVPETPPVPVQAHIPDVDAPSVPPEILEAEWDQAVYAQNELTIPCHLPQFTCGWKYGNKHEYVNMSDAQVFGLYLLENKFAIEEIMNSDHYSPSDKNPSTVQQAVLFRRILIVFILLCMTYKLGGHHHRIHVPNMSHIRPIYRIYVLYMSHICPTHT